MIVFLLLTAAAIQDCSRKPTATAKDECLLHQSMALDEADHFNCQGRNTQSDLNVCSFRDYLEADIELNRLWSAATKRLAGQPKILGTLLNGQRSWLAYRDKQCDVWAKLYEGGTIASLAVNTCLIDITRFRTKELGQLLENR